jgi:hypothetical protein
VAQVTQGKPISPIDTSVDFEIVPKDDQIVACLANPIDIDAVRVELERVEGSKTVGPRVVGAVSIWPAKIGILYAIALCVALWAFNRLNRCLDMIDG